MTDSDVATALLENYFGYAPPVLRDAFAKALAVRGATARDASEAAVKELDPDTTFNDAYREGWRACQKLAMEAIRTRPDDG